MWNSKGRVALLRKYRNINQMFPFGTPNLVMVGPLSNGGACGPILGPKTWVPFGLPTQLQRGGSRKHVLDVAQKFTTCTNNMGWAKCAKMINAVADVTFCRPIGMC